MKHISYSICATILLASIACSESWYQVMPHPPLLVIPLKCTVDNFFHGTGMGSISLVGSGPGNPDLLTVQAVKLIKSADLVISDRLVSPEILSLVECKLLVANKKPGCADEAQNEIYEWAKEAVTAGKNVVRLKIGDPFLFGRGGEEILEFRKLGVEPTIVAGISSSYAAPLVAKIPLTHRGVSSQVLISTGYGKDSQRVDIPEYHPERTVVLLMAVGRLTEITDDMLQMKGYPSNTPVAIVENASNVDERVVIGMLKDIVVKARDSAVKAPAVVIVGQVVNVLL
jgi:uroporphyrin-III C-methyltransferase